MAIAENFNEYYQAFVNKNKEYEGVFYVGVKTTGVFCRPTCPAKKPKFENCEFFETAQQALKAFYRPCRRCHPLPQSNRTQELIQKLIEEVEKSPLKRWKDNDFKALAINAATVRRHFKKRFGVTFLEYTRAKRMEAAMKQISSGEPVIEAQLSTGYESSSGFRDAFSRITGVSPSKLRSGSILKSSLLDTHLGPMIAISDEDTLFLLEFMDRRGMEREIERFRQKTKSIIIPGSTPPIVSITRELHLYFDGKLKEFKTPYLLIGTRLQKRIWEELIKIPFGQTKTYANIATAIGNPSATYSVVRASCVNPFIIVVPCHRVVTSEKDFGNYSSGLARKKWLIAYENKMQSVEVIAKNEVVVQEPSLDLDLK